MKKNKKPTISIALAVYNEEKNLKRFFESVKSIADEIVVVDGGSTDNTVLIAKKYAKKVIETDNPPIFHINKQKAVGACTGAWILQMDADEEITQDLKKEIMSVVSSTHARNGYNIARNNYFGNKLMRYGGTYPDYVIRLFKKGRGHFPCKSVHEQIAIDGKIGYLKHPMNHYPYRTFDDYHKKARSYTSLTAKKLKKYNVSKSFKSEIIYKFIKPVRVFISLYIRQKGFMDGWWGFVWAYYSGRHYAQAYSKYLKM